MAVGQNQQVIKHGENDYQNLFCQKISTYNSVPCCVGYRPASGPEEFNCQFSSLHSIFKWTQYRISTERDKNCQFSLFHWILPRIARKICNEMGKSCSFVLPQLFVRYKKTVGLAPQNIVYVKIMPDNYATEPSAKLMQPYTCRIGTHHNGVTLEFPHCRSRQLPAEKSDGKFVAFHRAAEPPILRNQVEQESPKLQFFASRIPNLAVFFQCLSSQFLKATQQN